MSTILPPREASDADQELQRLEARILSGDLAMRERAGALLAVAAKRAERTAAWSALALAGVGALVILDLWIRGRTRSRAHRI